MESHPSEKQTIEAITPKTKVEVLISKSHFAGNFSDLEEWHDPDKDLYMIKLDSTDTFLKTLPELPRGYGFTGGVARRALLELLGEKSPPIADIDIESIEEFDPDMAARVELENTFKQNDGVAKISNNKDLVSYFSSRDFTISEVFIYKNKLYFSKRAAADIENKIIRPTEHETGDEGRDYPGWNNVKPKLLVKALLLEIEFIKQYGQGSVDDAESWSWQIYRIPPFNLALGLDKAAKKEVELDFLKRLFDLGKISPEDVPEGVTLAGVRRLAWLTKRWMLQRHYKREFEYSDKFFDRAYSEEKEAEDDQKLSEFCKTAISRAVKIKNVPTEDLELE